MQVAPQPEKKKSKRGLIALIVVAGLSVPCLGCLAAIAIPAFIGYQQRSKTSEATSELRALFAGAAAYYDQEHFGANGTVRTHCTVDPAVTPNVPGRERTVPHPLPPSFEALGFTPVDAVYYRYEIVSVPGCDHPSDTPLYSFRAHGDLDGDGQRSVFELAAGSDAQGRLYQAPGLFIENELE
jgi:hypothetical protein